MDPGAKQNQGQDSIERAVSGDFQITLRRAEYKVPSGCRQKISARRRLLGFPLVFRVDLCLVWF
jgi:hypothetical protein